METQLNRDRPLVMHIDLNSCFATVIQQAHPHLRHRPVVIAAYTTPGGCILAPSIEAKKLGIKTGMRVGDAREICPTVVVRESDPELIRDASARFQKICEDYCPDVVPKSIDEVVIDFSGMKNFLKKNLPDIGREIKQRFRKEIGEWISCNVGISTNRFLAKLASSLHKPDGLDVIDSTNLIKTYSQVVLTDFNGINLRYEARLNAAGIMTPLDFLNAPEPYLRKVVFKSIVGHYWYKRLRGFEVDNFSSPRKTFGQDYALAKKTADRQELSGLIMKLCEKMGRRLRGSGNAAYGIHLGLAYYDWTFWHKARKFGDPLYTTPELFGRTMSVFDRQPQRKIVTKISVACYDLTPLACLPMTLFETDLEKKRKVSDAVDRINDRYGEFVVVPALMMRMGKVILDRIAFGGLRSSRH